MSLIIKTIMLCLAVVCSACQKQALNDTLKIGELTELKVSVPALNNTNDLSLTVEKIDDSRCPVGVDCIWEGTATVSFKLVTKQGVYNFNLDTNLKPMFVQDTLIEQFRYQLVDVKPYPNINNLNVESFAYVMVTKE